MRRLHGGDGRVLGFRDVDQLPGAARGAVRHMEMVSHKVQKSLSTDEFPPAKHRVAVAPGIGLGDKAHAIAKGAACGAVGGFVARADDDAKFLDTRGGGLLEDDLEGGF